MGDKFHLTASISPNHPGDNRFHVTLWAAEQTGKPKQVKFTLKNPDKPDMAPLEVPLILVSVTDKPMGSIHWLQFDYAGQGPYLPFPGDWRIEVRITDGNDNETVYAKEDTVF